MRNRPPPPAAGRGKAPAPPATVPARAASAKPAPVAASVTEEDPFDAAMNKSRIKGTVRSYVVDQLKRMVDNDPQRVVNGLRAMMNSNR